MSKDYVKKQKCEKILISIAGFTQGGAEIFPIRLANYLKKNNIDVYLHAMNPYVETFVRDMVNPGIKVFICDSRFAFISYLAKEKFTVIHTHCNSNQMFLTRCKKLVPWLKFKHIATCHGVYEGMEYEEAKRQILFCDPYVTHWTYVANNNYETLQKVGIQKYKCIKIGNSMEFPEKITAIDRKIYGISDTSRVVTVISRAVGKKCWNECIEVVTKAREKSGIDIQLILGGLGALYDALLKEGTPEYIHLVGAVSRPCDIYAASDLGMLLSVRECAPLGLIEMYYADTPVLATDTGDVNEMMTTETQKTGIVVPLKSDGNIETEACVDALIKLLSDVAYYEQCLKAVNDKKKEFSMEKICGKYLDLYRR